MLPQWGKAASGTLKRIICLKRSTISCVLIGVYMTQKTIPWVVVHIVENCGYSMNLKYFELAAPRAGFLLTLCALTVEIWRQTFGGFQSPFCKPGATMALTHLSFGVPGLELLHL